MAGEELIVTLPPFASQVMVRFLRMVLVVARRRTAPQGMVKVNSSSGEEKVPSHPRK